MTSAPASATSPGASRRPRITVVSHYFPPHVGGIERAAQTQAEQLGRAGYDVTVVTTAAAAPVGEEQLEPHLRVIRVPTANLIEERTRIPFPLIGLRGAVTLFKAIGRADIVHVHDLLYLTTWLAVACSVLRRKRLFLTQHVHIIDHPSRFVVAVQHAVYQVMGRLILPRVDQICYLNATVHEFLLQLGARRDQLTFVPNIVDTHAFRPPADAAERRALRARYGLPTDGVLALFVGRFVPKKGFEKVIAAAGSGYTIVMVGGDAPPAQRPDPGAQVRWLGSRDPADVSQLYRACDIFILPSVSEGFPLTVQEAMSSGMAVITTDDPGYRLYELDPRHLRLISPEVAEIKDTLMSVAGDAGLRSAMADYSRRYAVERFSRRGYLDSLAAVYAGPPTGGDTARVDTVAVVTPYYSPSVGGVQAYARQIANRLQAEPGLRPVVITTGSNRFTVEVTSVAGIPVYRLPVALRLSNTPFHPAWPAMLRRIFIGENVAVINSHAPVPLVADAAVLAAGGRPVVATYHSGSMVKGGSRFDPLIRLYERRLLPRVFGRARTVVAASPTTLGSGRANGEVITPGVDPTAFRPPTEKREGRSLLYVGRMDLTSQWKGVDVLITAFHQLRTQLVDLELRLVGAGDAVPSLRRLAADLGCADGVVFPGQLQGTDLAAEYQRARVLVLPSRTDAESFGMTLIEAMACGCPVVGSRVGGVQHVISDGENGLLVPPGDAAALAAACQRILTDVQLAEKLADNGRLSAELTYSWESRLDRWVHLLTPDGAQPRLRSGRS